MLSEIKRYTPHMQTVSLVGCLSFILHGRGPNLADEVLITFAAALTSISWI